MFSYFCFSPFLFNFNSARKSTDGRIRARESNVTRLLVDDAIHLGKDELEDPLDDARSVYITIITMTTTPFGPLAFFDRVDTRPPFTTCRCIIIIISFSPMVLRA